MTRENRRLTRLAANIPMLPANKIRECWNDILQMTENNNFVVRFKHYFEKQLLNKYSLDIISVADKRHRTNNPVEGWNRRINAHTQKSATMILYIK